MLNEYLSTTVDQRMVLDFRSEMFEHAQKLSLAFHDNESKGILMYRINNQAGAMGQIVVGLPALAQSVLTIIGMAYITYRSIPCWRCWRWGPRPFIVYSTTFYTDRIEPRLYRVRGLGAMNLAIVYEAMSMMRVVLAFGHERREYKRFRKQGEKWVDARVGLTVRQTAFKLAVQMITAAGTAAVIGVGAYQAVNGQITAGELLVVLSYISPDLHAARGADAHDHQLPAVVHQPADGVRPDGHRARGQGEGGRASRSSAPAARSSSTASGSATRARPDVLKDVSLQRPRRATPSRSSGPTGAGKSTLVSLLPRFYDAAEGRVLIDGVDVRDLKLDDAARQFSIVLQEPLLFSGTIADNIRYGKPDASRRGGRGGGEGGERPRLHHGAARRATRRCSASAGRRSPAASASGSPSPARSCATRRS